MQEELKNTPDIDPSGLFSTYKTHPHTSEENRVTSSPYPLPPQKKNEDHTNESNSIKALRIISESAIRIIKIAVWCIAIFGGLFIASLATNTIDRVFDIINTNLGTNLTLSGEVQVNEQKTSPQDKEGPTAVQGITSSALTNSTSNTPETVASKRRAILEARKAARLLEEKQNTLEQLP